MLLVGSVDTESAAELEPDPRSPEDGSGFGHGRGSFGVLQEWRRGSPLLGCRHTSLSGKVWEVPVADRSRVPVWEGDSESVFSPENFPCF